MHQAEINGSPGTAAGSAQPGTRYGCLLRTTNLISKGNCKEQKVKTDCYMICGTQHSIKMWVLCSNTVTDFPAVMEEHETQGGPSWAWGLNPADPRAGTHSASRP